MQAPESAIPIPKARPAATNAVLTGPMCALGGRRSELVSGKNCPKITAYPIAPTAIALRIDKNGVVSRSSMASRKIQKKQKRPLSNAIPRALPINRDSAALVPVPSLSLNWYAVKSNPTTNKAASPVLIESLLLQVETSVEVPESPEPLPKLVTALITLLPK